MDSHFSLPYDECCGLINFTAMQLTSVMEVRMKVPLGKSKLSPKICAIKHLQVSSFGGLAQRLQLFRKWRDFDCCRLKKSFLCESKAEVICGFRMRRLAFRWRTEILEEPLFNADFFSSFFVKYLLDWSKDHYLKVINFPFISSHTRESR